MDAMNPEQRGFHREAKLEEGVEQRRALRVSRSLDGIGCLFRPHWTPTERGAMADGDALMFGKIERAACLQPRSRCYLNILQFERLFK
jgi:hypothetical protein